MTHKNEVWFNSLFSIIYFYSKSRTHSISVKMPAGDGRADNIFLPIDERSNVAVIHEYKFTNNSKETKDLL